MDRPVPRPILRPAARPPVPRGPIPRGHVPRGPLEAPGALDALAAAVARRRDDMVALARDLVRIPTRNPPGENYRAICDALARRLSAAGYAVRLVRADGAPGDTDAHPRWNLLARREGAGPGPCVHLNGHTDVVEPGAGWSVDPFGGTIRDGRLYGRGACDMKGGIAAMIVAAEAFAEVFPDFPGAIEISATADEESGGHGGVAHLARMGVFDPARTQHVIIPEPLGAGRVCLGHRGGWWAEIETFGEIAHGAMPFLGDCAIRHMGAVLGAFEEELYPALARRRTSMPVVPEGARASTVNLSSVHGGQAEPPPGSDARPAHCVPDRARIVIDRRYLAEETREGVRAEVVALLEGLRARRPRFGYALREIDHVAPSMTAEDAPVARAVARAIEGVTGRRAEFVASPGSYDQKHIDRIGKLKDCVAYGPGILDLAHKPDEWVGLDDMAVSAEVIARSLAALLLGADGGAAGEADGGADGGAASGRDGA